MKWYYDLNIDINIAVKSEYEYCCGDKWCDGHQRDRYQPDHQMNIVIGMNSESETKIDDNMHTHVCCAIEINTNTSVDANGGTTTRTNTNIKIVLQIDISARLHPDIDMHTNRLRCEIIVLVGNNNTGMSITANINHNTLIGIKADINYDHD